MKNLAMIGVAAFGVLLISIGAVREYRGHMMKRQDGADAPRIDAEAELLKATDPEEAFYWAQVKKYGPPFGAENRVVGKTDASFNELAQAFWGFAEWLEEYNVRFRYVGGPVFRSPKHSAHDEVTVIAAIGWYSRLTKPSAHVNRIFAEWQRRYSFTAPAVHVIDEGGNILISQDLNGQTGKKEELERDP